MTSAPERQKSTTLSTRDLVNVGVFTAMYFVVMFAMGMMGFLGPAFMFVGHTAAIIANGVVITLFLARVRKFGALSILGALVCLAMASFGEPVYVLIGLVLAPLGDLVARTGAYKSAVRNSLGYAVFSVWYIGPLLPIFFDSAGYREYVTETMNADYANGLLDLVSSPVLVGWAVFVFAVAFASGLFGHRVLRRHFKRAGLAS